MNNDIKPVQRAKAVAVAAERKTLPKVPEIHVPIKEAKHKHASKVKVRLHKRVHWWLKSLSRKQFIFAIALFFILAGGAAYGIWQFSKQDFKEASSVVPDVPEPPAKPVTVASRMTGVQVAPELNNLPVTGVMIENSPEARPQSGLQQADLVFEAIAEGGITRFLALYQESQPDYIGPVRSVRPYYLDFLAPYDAAIAHAGGSAEALAQIRSQGFKDLDHGANGSTYERVSNRYSPHNLFTSRSKLLALQNKKGFTSSTYQGFARKADEAPSATPTARSIDLTISSFLYNPHYDYDPATNTYKRSEGGKPHVDERTGTQITPKVVIALVSSHRYAGIYSVYQVTGSGQATVFQDGVAIPVTWTKTSRKSEFVFTDSAGAVLPLNPGQTWISLVGAAGNIKYVP